MECDEGEAEPAGVQLNFMRQVLIALHPRAFVHTRQRRIAANDDQARTRVKD